MAERFVKKSTLVGWADAIRAKKGTSYLYDVSNFASEILSISTETEGLLYTLDDSGTYYIVSGIGTATDENITIPETHEGLPVREIGENAFKNNTTIKSIDTSNVEWIQDAAFLGCVNLKTANLSKVTRLYLGAFNGCTSLSSVVLGSVKGISTRTFHKCTSLTSINLPKSLESISPSAFSYSNVSTVTYEGTMAEWNAVNLQFDWNGNAPITYVICTDGKVFTGATITFTVDGTTYEAKYGMTWEDWVADTTLNTGGYVREVLSGVKVAARMISAAKGYGIAYEDAFVPITETIVSGRTYTEKYGQQGGDSN